MHPENECGRATWTHPEFAGHYGAPGTALHVTITLDDTIIDRSDVRYIARVHGIVHAGVADSAGAGDAHDCPRTADRERAGRALAHPLVLLMSDRTVAALADIATGDTATTSERLLLRQALAAIDAAEIALSREARP